MFTRKLMCHLPVLFSLLFYSGIIMAAGTNPMANSDPLYSQLRAVALGSEFYHVEKLQLKRDIATLNFKAGTFYFLSPVEGHVTGAVFLGQGEIQVVPFLPQEQEFMRVQSGSPSFTEHFEKMVLRFTDSTAEEIKRASNPQAGTPNSAAAAFWQDYQKLMREGRTWGRYNAAAGICSKESRHPPAAGSYAPG